MAKSSRQSLPLREEREMTTLETKGEKGKRERQGQRVGIKTGGERMGSKRKRWLVFGRVRKRKLGGEIEVNGVRVLLKDLTKSCAVHMTKTLVQL
jgi:hypothetical protein